MQKTFSALLILIFCGSLCLGLVSCKATRYKPYRNQRQPERGPLPCPNYDCKLPDLPIEENSIYG